MDGPWTLTPGGPTAAVTTDNPRTGTYALRLFSATAGKGAEARFNNTGFAAFRGLDVVFKVWVDNTATACAIEIDDGIGATQLQFSSTSGYEQKTVTRTIDTGATKLQFRIRCGANTTMDNDDMEANALDSSGGVLLEADSNRAIYQVEVDWNNDEDFNDANESIRGEVLAMRWDRGREAELEHAAAGILELTLRNDTGKYSPENSSSVLSPNVLPGRRIRVWAVYDDTGAKHLWRGFIEKFVPLPASADGKLCYILAVDGFDQLARDTIEAPATGIFKDKRPGEDPGPVETILDEAGWPTGTGAGRRTIEDSGTSYEDFEHWWVHDQSPLEALRDIEESDRSFMYVDEEGRFVYEDRHHRHKDAGGGVADHLTSQATFTDTMKTFNYEFSARSVRNIARVKGTKRTAKTAAKVYGTRDSLKIGQGQTRELIIPLPNPAESIDFDATTGGAAWKVSATEGGSADATLLSNVVITKTLYGQSLKLSIANNNTQTGYLIPGTDDANDTLYTEAAEYDEDEIIAFVEDTTSQGKYNNRAIAIDAKFRSTWNSVMTMPHGFWRASRTPRRTSRSSSSRTWTTPGFLTCLR